MFLRRGHRYFLISIHAPREGGDDYMAALLTTLGISIHAPREGGDYRNELESGVSFYFNPRPPRGGRRDAIYAYTVLFLFQSTPPARGATGWG